MLSVYGTQSSKATHQHTTLVVWGSLTVWLLWGVGEPSQQVNRAAAPPTQSVSLHDHDANNEYFLKPASLYMHLNQSTVDNNIMIIFYIQLYGMSL